MCVLRVDPSGCAGRGTTRIDVEGVVASGKHSLYKHSVPVQCVMPTGVRVGTAAFVWLREP